MNDENILDLIMASLYHHGIGEVVALKGGYLLYKLLHSRTTTDIDLSMSSIALWPNLQRALVECGVTANGNQTK